MERLRPVKYNELTGDLRYCDALPQITRRDDLFLPFRFRLSLANPHNLGEQSKPGNRPCDRDVAHQSTHEAKRDTDDGEKNR